MSRVHYFFDGRLPYACRHSYTPEGALTYSLDEMMRLYWRVQSWGITITAKNISCTSTLTGGRGPARLEAQVLTCTAIRSRDDGSSNETYLVAPSPWQHDVATTTALGAGVTPSLPISYTSESFAGQRFYNTDDAPRYGIFADVTYDPSTQLYSPVISVGHIVAKMFAGPSTPEFPAPSYSLWVGTDGDNTDYFIGDDIHGATSSQELTIPATFMGQYIPDVAGGMSAFMVGVERAGGLQLEEVSIAIQPTSYWTYARSDGTRPLYNGGTGERETNPDTGLPYTDAEIITALERQPYGFLARLLA